jgi:hypothetical protein
MMQLYRALDGFESGAVTLRVLDSSPPFRHKPASLRGRRPPTDGGVSCDGQTISTTSRAFEVTRKRRRGLSLGDPRQARRPRRARRQGADREARAQRPLPLRLRTQISRPAACAPAASPAANASTMCAIEPSKVVARTNEVTCGSPESCPGFRGACHRAALRADPSAHPGYARGAP